MQPGPEPDAPIEPADGAYFEFRAAHGPDAWAEQVLRDEATAATDREAEMIAELRTANHLEPDMLAWQAEILAARASPTPSIASSLTEDSSDDAGRPAWTLGQRLAGAGLDANDYTLDELWELQDLLPDRNPLMQNPDAISMGYGSYTGNAPFHLHLTGAPYQPRQRRRATPTRVARPWSWLWPVLGWLLIMAWWVQSANATPFRPSHTELRDLVTWGMPHARPNQPRFLFYTPPTPTHAALPAPTGGPPHVLHGKGIAGFDPGDEGSEQQHAGHPRGQRVNSAISMHLPDGVYVTPASDRFETDPDTLIQFGNHQEGTPETLAAIKGVVGRYGRRGPDPKKNTFSYDLTDLPGYDRPEGVGPGSLRLRYIADTPHFAHRKRQSALEIAISDEKCKELLGAGIIEPAPESPYASSPVIAAKKDAQGQWTEHRYCVNYRGQNLATAPMHTNVPVADVLFQRLGKAKWYSKLDMRSGYLQLPVHPDSNRTPFGLRNAPAAFQAVMDFEIRKAGLEDNVVCFIDDILVFSETPEEHVQLLERVFEMLLACGLRAHPEKSQFGSDTIDFLGFEVSQFGLTPQEARVKALVSMPAPTCLEELRVALGKLRYYGTFCTNFSSRARAMLDLLKKDVPWKWGAEEQAAYDDVKQEIAKPGNALMRFDPTRPTFVHCDFSNVGLGAVLAQVDEAGHERMVACASRSLSVSERRYSSYKANAWHASGLANCSSLSSMVYASP